MSDRTSSLVITIAAFALTLMAVLRSLSAWASMPSPDLVKLADQYQCNKTSGTDQSVDVLLNGSSQRFQGVARTHGGKLIEVAGVIADYYPSAAPLESSASRAVANSAEGIWQEFMIEMQLTNKLIMERLKGSLPAGSEGMPGYGPMGGMGMAGGIGFSGAPSSKKKFEKEIDQSESGETSPKASSDSPWGQSAGGPLEKPTASVGLFGIGMGAMGYVGVDLISEQEREQIRQQAAEISIRERERRAAALEQKRLRREQERAFAPPVPPPAPTAPPRIGDQLPQRPGDLIAQQERPGDAIARRQRPGDAVMEHIRPGDEVVQRTRPGDYAVYMQQTPGDAAAMRLRPGDLVPPPAGSVIGTANSLTFTAVLDPRTGRIVQIQYREADKTAQSIRVISSPRSNDPVQNRVMEFVRRVQGLARCCQRDSTSTCDQRYSAESQQALKDFRQETESTLGEVGAGGALFNPFGSAPRGQVAPRQPSSRPATRQPTAR